MNKKLHHRIFLISLYAIYTALIFVLTFVPFVGFISLGIVSMTTIHIAVLVFCYLTDWKSSIVFGAIFGFASLIRVLTSPAGVFDYCFVNPMVSIVPRIIFAVIAGLLFQLVKKNKNLGVKIVLVVIISIVSTFIHSILVLGMCGVFYFAKLNEAYLENGGFWVVMGSTLLLNTLPEMGLAGLLVSPVGISLEGVYNRVSLGRMAQNER